MNLISIHMLLVFCWAVFMVSLAKSLSCGEKSRLLAVLSLFFMFAVLFIGTEIMLMMPQITKSGMWLHVKLSFDILVMLENIYLAVIAFKSKPVNNKIVSFIYWSSILMFIAMYYLTMFRPF
jgi:putative membrane protein